MKLYYSPGACSQAVHIALRELDLPFEPVQVDLKTHTLDNGDDYYKVNPKGYVPALELDDASLLTEGAAILQYVADLKPEAGLLPSVGTKERYRTIEWLTFISSELHKTFGPLWKADYPEAAQQIALATLKQRFDWLDRHLAHNVYLIGNRFTVADAYAYTILNWAPFFKIDVSSWSNLAAYIKRVAARPSVRDTARAEKLAA